MSIKDSKKNKKTRLNNIKKNNSAICLVGNLKCAFVCFLFVLFFCDGCCVVCFVFVFVCFVVVCLCFLFCLRVPFRVARVPFSAALT